MMISGHGRDVAFFCERCAVGDTISIRTAGGRFKQLARRKEPGVCVGCGGTGKDEIQRSKRCGECGGSGVCPECNGNYSRSWSELPLAARNGVLSKLDHGEDLLAGYETIAGLYREW